MIDLNALKKGEIDEVFRLDQLAFFLWSDNSGVYLLGKDNQTVYKASDNGEVVTKFPEPVYPEVIAINGKHYCHSKKDGRYFFEIQGGEVHFENAVWPIKGDFKETPLFQVKKRPIIRQVLSDCAVREFTHDPELSEIVLANDQQLVLAESKYPSSLEEEKRVVNILTREEILTPYNIIAINTIGDMQIAFASDNKTILDYKDNLRKIIELPFSVIPDGFMLNNEVTYLSQRYEGYSSPYYIQPFREFLDFVKLRQPVIPNPIIYTDVEDKPVKEINSSKFEQSSSSLKRFFHESNQGKGPIIVLGNDCYTFYDLRDPSKEFSKLKVSPDKLKDGKYPYVPEAMLSLNGSLIARIDGDVAFNVETGDVAFDNVNNGDIAYPRWLYQKGDSAFFQNHDRTVFRVDINKMTF